MDRITELENKAAERCEYYRQQGFHCSESSIRAVSETLGIELPEDILKVSSGFRGGGGGYMERCGITEAGIILISYLYGRTNPEADVADYSYLIRVLHERFIREMGSYICRQLLPFSQKNTPDKSCALTYEKGAKILTRLLLEADQLIKDMPQKERDLVVIWEPTNV